MCPKSIGWLHSERTQVSELIDGLEFMVVLRHVMGCHSGSGAGTVSELAGGVD